LDEKIDNLIYEMQLRINNHDDIVVEWIPYNQFNNIKKIGKGGFATVYSAVWVDGSLNYYKYKIEYKRTPNKEVALKELYNSQNIASEFLNEVWIFP
jgi:serine/threonine protein kinase